MSDLVKFLSVLASEVMPLNRVKELVAKYNTSHHNSIDPAVEALVGGWLKASTAKAFISAVDPITVLDNLRNPPTVKDVLEATKLEPTTEVLSKLPWTDPNTPNNYKKPEPVVIKNEFSGLPWNETKDTILDKYVEMTEDKEEQFSTWDKAMELVKGVKVDLDAPLPDDEDDALVSASSLTGLVGATARFNVDKDIDTSIYKKPSTSKKNKKKRKQ